MENSGEDLSSTASHSFSGDDGGSAASEESGWTSYIDYFMETQRHKEEVSRDGDPSTDEAGAGRRCSSTSECSSDTGVGASTWLPPLVEPSTVVSRRLSLREGWRRKKVMYDESLEDTATSPISSPNKLIELRDSDATHHQNKENSCDEISRSKRKSTGGDVNNGANTTIDMTIKEDGAYDNNELMRKKGLFLVPMSASFHI